MEGEILVRPVKVDEALLGGGGGGGGGPVIPYPSNSEHSYPLSLKVSTALSPKVSRVEFSIIP